MIRIIPLLMLLVAALSHAEQAPPTIHSLAQDLRSWGQDATLVQAVKTQNNQKMSLADIKARDAVWRKTDGLDDQMKEMMNSPAATRLKEMEKTGSYFFELFLVDDQGANVAMTNKTSDYWQGDEAKWQKSFDNRAGATHIGEVEYDESTSAYLVQVSIPVMDDDQAIGAITIGINLDEFEAQ